MKPVEIKKDIYWVGAVDWDVRDFHGYMTEKGTTYNSYLLVDEKTVLFDTVKHDFFMDILHRIHEVTEPEKIDYMVLNHMEPDHSGCLPEVVEKIKPEKIFVSPMGLKSLNAYFNNPDWPLEVVKTGQSINTGKHTISFLETRMVHWPDSMFSYIPEEKMLISNDGFGLHWATSQRFDDEVDFAELMHHAGKYFANILMLYAPLIQKLLATVEEMGLEIDTIAPDHGVIWRKNPQAILEAYGRWTRQEACNKALVVYDTMWHSTELMAKAIYGALSDAGMEVKLMNLAVTHRSDVMTELLDAKAIVLGSPTLNNTILPRMADMLTYMSGLKPQGKVAAAFGSYGWSGESVKHIQKYLEDMKLNIVEPGLKVQYRPHHEALKKCVEFGAKIAEAAGAPDACGTHP